MKPTAFIFLVMLAATPAWAQSSRVDEAPAAAAPDDAVPADIEFAATVRMKSLSFGSTPLLRVDLSGDPAGTRQDTERDGLPTPVKTGTTYRDVTVRTTVRASVTDALQGMQTPPSPSITPEDSP